MKLKDIKGLLPEGVKVDDVIAYGGHHRLEIGETEIEIDEERVEHIIDNTVIGTDAQATLKIKDFFPEGTGERVAQAIKDACPIRKVK